MLAAASSGAARLARGRWYRKAPDGTPERPPIAPGKEASARPEDDRSGGRVLRCARCGHVITRPEARTEVAGQHVHVRINPHGYVWRFGCFSRAPGCRPEGGRTSEHTWFAGYAWQIQLCGVCRIHLGWRFAPEGGSGEAFFGLVLEQLVEEEESPGAEG